MKLTGAVVATVAAGRVQYNQADLRAERGAGRYLKRGPSV
jgi:N-acyl-D-aspartate/D-glutamate deacylase